MRAPILALGTFLSLPLALPQAPDTPTAAAPAQKGPLRQVAAYKTVVIRLNRTQANLAHAVVQQIFGHRDSGPDRLISSFDPSSDSIILSAPDDLLQEATKLIKSLDAAPVGERRTHLVALSHARAVDLVNVLQQAISQQEVGPTSPARPGLAVDERTNTLLVTANEAHFDILQRLIEKLDAPANARQVVIAGQGNTRLEVAAFSVSLPRERVTTLDIEQLRRDAATPESLLGSLNKLGPSQALCRLDQPVDLARLFSTRLGESVPVVQSSQKLADQTTRQVSYKDVGCIVSLKGGWEDATTAQGRFEINLELSHIADSTIELTAGAKAPVFVKATQDFGGFAQSGRPIVLLSVSAGENSDTARAYVTRLVLTAEPAKAPA